MNKPVFKEIVAPLFGILLACFLGVVVIAVVSGCEPVDHETNTVEFNSEAGNPNSVYWSGHYLEWTYIMIRGHRYIGMRYGEGDSMCFSFEHDVDCPKCNGVSPTEDQTVPETSPSSDYEILFGKN